MLWHLYSVFVEDFLLPEEFHLCFESLRWIVSKSIRCFVVHLLVR